MTHSVFCKKKMRFRSLLHHILLILLLFISVLLLLPAHYFADEPAHSSPALEDKILRLHILAAGNDTASQELKLHVRDEILALIQDTVSDATTAKEAEAALLPRLDEIVIVANRVLADAGVSYHATAELATEFFPIKQYGSVLLPPGEYRALRIVLDEGKGKNWWCMLYPSLCLTEGITATIPDEEKEELRGLLTEEEYDTLFSAKAKKPLFRFRLLELWEELTELLHPDK
ncbi:MAG: stage II sporulation protein R [Lachnospiraceae bacterium]|nr:stage II sporulation protein R [Lachnospiraceae bacterium]